MDNAQKALMIGIGLFITIIIISAVLLITNLGTGLIGDAGAEVINMSSTVKQTLLDKYDGKTITGKEVLEAVRKYKGDDEVSLFICTLKSYFYIATYERNSVLLYYGKYKITGYGTWYQNLTDVNKYKLGGISGNYYKTKYSSSSENTYNDAVSKINAKDKYKTALIYDSNGNLLGVAMRKI